MSRILPILFNTDMVRAILDERKTTTRRAIKNIDIEENDGIVTLYEKYRDDAFYVSSIEIAKKEMLLYSRYQPGDILYVRETWCSGYDGEAYFYLADKNTEREQKQLIDYDDRKWHPSIHMPKEAARIWLKVTDVRVERLQDMKLNDFLNEGVVIRPEAYNDPDNAYMQAREQFRFIWESTIKKPDLDRYGWDANPWVWPIEFERCGKPEGAI